MHNWLDWVANGALPLILLIGLWIFFMRKMPRPPYSKQLELLEQQISVLRETNDLLRKLAAIR